MITFDQDLTLKYQEVRCTDCEEILIKGHFNLKILDSCRLSCKKCEKESTCKKQTNKEIDNGRRGKENN